MWALTSSGIFLVKSTRQAQQLGAGGIPWQHLWRFKGPSRYSFTMWTCLHNALPTTTCLWKCGLLELPLCGYCKLYEQSSLLLLRNCKITKAVWQILLPPGVDRSFFAAADVIWWISRFVVLK